MAEGEGEGEERKGWIDKEQMSSYPLRVNISFSLILEMTSYEGWHGLCTWESMI